MCIRDSFKTGTLTVNKQVYEVKGRLQVSIPKTRASIRRLVLPPGVVEVLRQYRETVDSRWMFPSPVKEDMPMTPGAVRRRLQIILERAGCKRIRFHDLRHTFATLSLENGMDVKLSLIHILPRSAVKFNSIFYCGFVGDCYHPMVMPPMSCRRVSSWSSGLWPMAIFFSWIFRRSFRSTRCPTGAAGGTELSRKI